MRGTLLKVGSVDAVMQALALVQVARTCPVSPSEIDFDPLNVSDTFTSATAGNGRFHPQEQEAQSHDDAD